ncbi:type I DNA topoisomerase [candidate division NPL-UPA2 bacterium]|nr:type I DNA topoisomerase [candidate division NPL-UPA2 bacterium]
MRKSKKKKNAKSLVIVESPAKARTINKFLGSNFEVKSCSGHVRDLPKNRFGVDVKSNFQPEYVTVPGRTKVIKEIKKKAGEVDRILLALDPDREGEAIAWHLAELLPNKANIYRIIFHEVTKGAIQEAVKNAHQIDLNKVNAQQARRILDRIVGYKLSPLLWRKVGGRLSAGRVQSVAVRLICEREREIDAFVPEEYWSVTAKLRRKKTDGKEFEAKLEEIDSKKAKIVSGEQAKKIVDKLKKEDFFVKDIKTKDKKRYPSPPFTTSYLQQEASRKLRFSASNTMRIAQQLYEGLEVGEEGSIGLITYMRTDSIRVASEAQGEASTYIKEKFGSNFAPPTPPRYKSKKGAQEAHEAIRPTSIYREPERLKAFLTPEQYRLYKLIWTRFLASQMKPAVLKITTVDIEAGRFLLRATGLEIKFKGFMVVYVESQEDGGREKEEREVEKEKENILPALKEGEKLTLIKLLPEQHFTKPPPRFSEAILVKALEEEGIGRPSTYAPIIQVIQSRRYVEKIKGRFHSTELGRIVTELLVEHFPKVLDVKFTANMEQGLDEVEEGRVDWVKLLRDFYQPFMLTVVKAGREMKRVKRKEKVTDEKCPQCDGVMVEKDGRYGRFLACRNFPKCKYTQPMTTGVTCPEDRCDGQIVEHRTKKGRTFFSCNRFPDCKFSLWNKPVEKECPDCGAKFLVEHRGRAGHTFYQCNDRECGYKEKEDVRDE